VGAVQEPEGDDEQSEAGGAYHPRQIEGIAGEVQDRREDEPAKSRTGVKMTSSGATPASTPQRPISAISVTGVPAIELRPPDRRSWIFRTTQVTRNRTSQPHSNTSPGARIDSA
jgi:hypothetical protein